MWGMKGEAGKIFAKIGTKHTCNQRYEMDENGKSNQ